MPAKPMPKGTLKSVGFPFAANELFETLMPQPEAALRRTHRRYFESIEQLKLLPS